MLLTQNDSTCAISPPHPQLSSLLVSPAVSAQTAERAPVFPSPMHRNGGGVTSSNKSIDINSTSYTTQLHYELQYNTLFGVTLELHYRQPPPGYTVVTYL